MYKILIADDDFPIRDWLAKCCRDILGEQTEVVTAANGEIAFTQFIKDPADIVFADIKMPVMDGLELTKRIRDMNAETYIVVLSSYDDFNYARTVFKNKVNEYVLKTEITGEFMRNILERAYKETSRSQEMRQRTEAYSFDQLIEELDAVSNAEEKRYLLEKYNIKYPSGSYFCVANYNTKKTYGSLRLIQEENIYKLFSIRAENAEINCFAITGEVSMLYQFQKMNLFMKKLGEMNSSQIICYGNIGGKPENVLHYAQNVLRGLNYRYYTDEKMFFADLLANSIQNYHHQDEEIRSAFRKIIENGDANNVTAVRSLIENWFDLLEQHVVLNIEDIRNRCCRIYESLHLSSDKETGIDAEFEKKIKQAEKVSEMRKQILDTLSSNIEQRLGIKTNSAAIQKALRYIYSNYATISGLAEVAEVAALNPEYFSRLFKEETGVNFSVYLNEYRLERAEKLLRTTDKKLYEISEETGFSSLSYFSRRFKEKFKKTPFEYRN